jgi:hypothetical protein
MNWDGGSIHLLINFVQMEKRGSLGKINGGDKNN